MKRKPGLLICIAILGMSLLFINSVAFGADKVIKLTFGSASSKGCRPTQVLRMGRACIAEDEGRVEFVLAQERKLVATKT